MLTLLAQHVVWYSGWNFASLAIAIVVTIAIIALVLVGIRYFKIEIPEWVKHVIGIVVVAFVIILAIRVVASM